MHDIIPVDDGFLLSNSSPGDREELIIHTDTSGKVLGKFLSADLSQAIWSVGKPLSVIRRGRFPESTLFQRYLCLARYGSGIGLSCGLW